MYAIFLQIFEEGNQPIGKVLSLSQRYSTSEMCSSSIVDWYVSTSVNSVLKFKWLNSPLLCLSGGAASVTDVFSVWEVNRMACSRDLSTQHLGWVHLLFLEFCELDGEYYFIHCVKMLKNPNNTARQHYKDGPVPRGSITCSQLNRVLTEDVSTGGQF